MLRKPIIGYRIEKAV